MIHLIIQSCLSFERTVLQMLCRTCAFYHRLDVNISNFFTTGLILLQFFNFIVNVFLIVTIYFCSLLFVKDLTPVMIKRVSLFKSWHFWTPNPPLFCQLSNSGQFKLSMNEVQICVLKTDFLRSCWKK